MSALRFPRVAITGGAGYVGSVLVPKLLARGHEVTVLDLFLYGKDVFDGVKDRSKLRLVEGDIRNPADLANAFRGADAIIHLACISNDPSFELNPSLGKTINFDCFASILDETKKSGAKRFIYASSSSVYGVREEPNVTEETPCTPLTDYSKFKLMCEDVLKKTDMSGCEWVILRPATVCGYAPRLRLDLTVNILTIHALTRKKITVHGGGQKRPNINIQDMADLYLLMLDAPTEKIHTQTFNGGYENHTVGQIAEMVKEAVADPAVSIVVEPTVDHRSYHIDSSRLEKALGFRARHSIQDATLGIAQAYRAGNIPNALDDPKYFNIKLMQKVDLK